MDFVETLEIDGVLYSNIVPMNYKLNPVTDDLLWADELRDGMYVLDGKVGHRFDPKRSDLYNEGLPRVNRWCTVTKLRVEGNVVFFIGLYDDGSKSRRTSDNVGTWLVKKSTISSRDEDSEN